ncbi:zinc metalloprotease HtpX [Selenomonas sp. TAMA-11512]|uniref:zinc metalloprotease HtpX n=1 Tax=Selenomonas sp. TAMA-11512 TaxID=3095337 RepID=UPI003088F96E|nr:zinc metalloprotease HtpX [Selenomonas sp. TAMA-11512]
MNYFKTTVLMALLIGVMVAVGGAFGGQHGAAIMLVISLGMSFFSYWFSDTMVLKAYHAIVIEPDNPDPNAQQLYRMVNNLAANADLPMPKVAIIQDSTPNAFATGRNPDHGVVAVTTGIMQALNYDELSGVIAHELSHIKNRDTLISTIVAAVAGAISMIAQMAQWAAIFGAGRSDDDDNGGIIGLLATIIIAPLAAMIIQMAISRTREYAADKSGGEICGNPLFLASALEKIDYFAKHARPMQDATPATSHMFIVNPLSGTRKAMMSLFSTHPATEDRIARLREQAAESGKM